MANKVRSLTTQVANLQKRAERAESEASMRQDRLSKLSTAIEDSAKSLLDTRRFIKSKVLANIRRRLEAAVG